MYISGLGTLVSIPKNVCEPSDWNDDPIAVTLLPKLGVLVVKYGNIGVFLRKLIVCQCGLTIKCATLCLIDLNSCETLGDSSSWNEGYENLH